MKLLTEFSKKKVFQTESECFLDEIQIMITAIGFIGFPVLRYRQAEAWLSVSIVNMVTAIFFIGFFLYATTSYIHDIMFDKNLEKNDHLSGIQAIMSVLNAIFVLNIFLHAFRHRIVAGKLITSFLRAEKDFKLLRVRQVKQKRTLLYAQNALHATSMLLNNFIFSIMFHQWSLNFRFSMIFNFSITSMSMLMINYLFTFFINLGTRWLSQINDAIQELASTSPFDSNKNTISGSNNIWFCKESDVASQKLEDFARVALDIHLIMEKTNQYFGLNVLLLVSNCFIYIVFTSFCLLSSLFDKNMISPNIYLLFFLNLAHGWLGTWYGLHVIISACTKNEQETLRTPKLLHLIINNNISPALTKKATMFSMQLMHCVSKFTATGFFPLDNTLIQSIVTSTTTHLVILLQFTAGGASEKNTST